MSLWCSRDHPAALVACSSRRRRRKVNAGDSSSWASLHEDLVSLIGWRVLAGDFRDYIRFRAVCPHWRSSTTCPRGRGILDPRFYPRGWMLLPEGRGLYPATVSSAATSDSSTCQLVPSSASGCPFLRITASSTPSMASSCCKGTMTLPSASFTPSPVIPQSSRRWRPSCRKCAAARRGLGGTLLEISVVPASAWVQMDSSE